jgi:hypothetical protein
LACCHAPLAALPTPIPALTAATRAGRTRLLPTTAVAAPAAKNFHPIRLKSHAVIETFRCQKLSKATLIRQFIYAPLYGAKFSAVKGIHGYRFLSSNSNE